LFVPYQYREPELAEIAEFWEGTPQEWVSEPPSAFHLAQGGLALADLPTRTIDVVHSDAEAHQLLYRRPKRLAVVDLRRTSDLTVTRTLQNLFFSVVCGGIYVCRSRTTELATQSLIARNMDAAATFPSSEWGIGNLKSFSADSYTQVIDGWTIIEKSANHLYCLGEQSVDEVLPTREPELSLTEWTVAPAATLAVNPPVSHHQTISGADLFPNQLDAPALVCRTYGGEVYVDNSLVFTGSTVLPPSFRFPRAGVLDNDRVEKLGGNYGKLKWSVGTPKEHLEGVFFDLSAGYASHFGHLMTQSVTKLYAWDRAKEQNPDLKGLVYVRDVCHTALERTLFCEGYGIDGNDLVFIDHAVQTDQLISATIAFQHVTPPYAHPYLKTTFSRFRERLVDSSVNSEPFHSERLFVSRSPENPARPCRNQPAVEAWFADRGFSVVYPEKYPLSVQASMFAAARIIAGFGGSAMFNLMFCSKLEHLIILTHEGYTARNEFLYAALLETPCVDYFWSPPDVLPAPGVEPARVTRSPWQFDIQANQSELEGCLHS